MIPQQALGCAKQYKQFEGNFWFEYVYDFVVVVSSSTYNNVQRDFWA